jgi:transcriptional regulator with XRE-family HTH domain
VTFADQLRAVRSALRCSQVELAARLGVTGQSVSNWECGRSTPWPRQQAELSANLTMFLLEEQCTVKSEIGRPRVCDAIDTIDKLNNL